MIYFHRAAAWCRLRRFGDSHAFSVLPLPAFSPHRRDRFRGAGGDCACRFRAPGAGQFRRSRQPAFAGGGEHLHHADRAGFGRGAGAIAGPAAGFAVAAAVQGSGQEQGRASPHHFAGQRIHHRPVGHRRDQQSRRGRCGRDHGDLERRHGASRQTHRSRRQDRSGAAESHAEETAAGFAFRKFRQGARRRLGGGDRQSVRSGFDGDGGYRFRAQSRHRRRAV